MVRSEGVWRSGSHLMTRFNLVGLVLGEGT